MSAKIRLRRGRSARTLGVLLGLALSALAFSSSAIAVEVPNHRFIGTVIGGTEGSPPRAKLDSPCGIALGPDDELFVADYFRRSILNATLPPYFPANGACGLAADPFNLYANYRHGGVVNVETGVITAEAATGIAVDPTSFDLYVDRRTSIAVYAAPVEPGELPAEEIDAGSGSALKNGYGIAVSAFPATAGWIYVADAADNTIKVFDPAAPNPSQPIQVIDGAGTAAGRFVSLVDSSLAIDQSTGHLFVVDNLQPGFEHPAAAVDEFNAAGIYRGQLPHALVAGLPTGIAIDESETAAKGRVYVTSGNGSSIVIPPSGGVPASELGSVFAFEPGGTGEILEAAVSGSGQGSVTSSPAGISCPGACKAELNSGAVVTLTAAAAPGSEFVGWSGACTGSGSCQVTLGGPAAVTAEFGPAPPAFAAGSPAGGDAVGSAVAIAGPSSDVATPSVTSLSLGRPRPAGNGAVSVPATVAGPGVLTARATGLRPFRVRFDRAGSSVLRLRLGGRGAQALAVRRTGLAMRVAFAFKPSSGAGASSLVKTVNFSHEGER